MPSVCRRIVALLVVACLAAVAPVTPALAQGAGDQQYQDPFGGSGTSTTKSSSGSTTTTTPSSGNLEPLSPSPQNGGSGTSGSSSSASSSPSSPATSSAPAPAAAAQGLPNTGADARMVLLCGAALLLIGLGLRLRSAPERF